MQEANKANKSMTEVLFLNTNTMP